MFWHLQNGTAESLTIDGCNSNNLGVIVIMLDCL